MKRLIATMIVLVSVLMAAVCQADSCEDNNRSRQQDYAECLRQCSNAREDCTARARVEWDACRNNCEGEESCGCQPHFNQCMDMNCSCVQPTLVDCHPCPSDICGRIAN